MKPAQIHRQLQRIERAMSGFPDDAMGTGQELLAHHGDLAGAMEDAHPVHSYVQHCAIELIRSALVLQVRLRHPLNLAAVGCAARLTRRHPISAAGQLDHATQAILRWRIERQPESCAFWIAHLVGISLAVIQQCDRSNYGRASSPSPGGEGWGEGGPQTEVAS